MPGDRSVPPKVLDIAAALAIDMARKDAAREHASGDVAVATSVEALPMELLSDLIRLDRKISRACSRGKGVGITASDLDLLATIGVLELVSRSAARAMKGMALERQRQRASR